MLGEESMLLWVCDCCMFTHANGECCDQEQHDHEPLSMVREGDHVTLGGAPHSDLCTPTDREQGCDCDDYGFSWQRCNGCGSTLGGNRYAMTLWWTPAVA